MIYGIKMGEYDTLAKWGMCLLSDLSVGTPVQKRQTADLPASDGKLDFSYSLSGGEPVFENREISFSLYMIKPYAAEALSHEDFLKAVTEMRQLYHGREGRIWLPYDSSHYFRGIINIDEKGGFHNFMLSVTMDAEPYRLKNEPSKKAVTAKGNVTLSNEGRICVPSFSSTGAYAFSFGGNSYSGTAGESVFPNVKLKKGDNAFNFTAVSGTVNISWQEGVL